MSRWSRVRNWTEKTVSVSLKFCAVKMQYLCPPHVKFLFENLLVGGSAAETRILEPRLFYGHVQSTDTRILHTSVFYKHFHSTVLSVEHVQITDFHFADTSTLRTRLLCGHVYFADTSILRTRLFCDSPLALSRTTRQMAG